MTHPALTPNRTAVITGGASGIGLATVKRVAAVGLNVCVADRDEEALGSAKEELAKLATRGGDAILAVSTDVTRLESVEALRDAVLDRFGEVALLMNNAGTGGGGNPWQNYEGWQRVLGVNLWGVIHGLQVFTQGMIDQGTPCAIVNTGSKQGITNPPGDAAYNVSKAGIKSLTESLAHQLRGIDGCLVTSHLLIPGFTYTGMMKRFLKEKPPAAWLPEQVADHLLAAMERGDFYVLCPDNEVTPEIDHRRIDWATGDLTENRPALSRWHPDYEAAFDAFMAKGRS
ncbi:MAG: SDR family NAD(P)-dependent oxidoreductase [Proteobacteria bacterium]|nr:SDR family NAD(P)-dependent oxidoreductase [Pseudomonadota bacterium]